MTSNDVCKAWHVTEYQCEIWSFHLSGRWWMMTGMGDWGSWSFQKSWQKAPFRFPEKTSFVIAITFMRVARSSGNMAWQLSSYIGQVFLFCGGVEIDEIQPLPEGASKEEKPWVSLFTPNTPAPTPTSSASGDQASLWGSWLESSFHGCDYHSPSMRESAGHWQYEEAD